MRLPDIVTGQVPTSFHARPHLEVPHWSYGNKKINTLSVSPFLDSLKLIEAGPTRTREYYKRDLLLPQKRHTLSVSTR
jgi:hypothetical protein